MQEVQAADLDKEAIKPAEAPEHQIAAQDSRRASKTKIAVLDINATPV